MKEYNVGYSLGPLLSTKELLEFAKQADNNPRVSSLWIPESWGRESFATLGAIAALTKRVKMGTSIINIYSRTPATIAMGVTTIDSLSNNRMILGLGTSTDVIVSGFHGLAYEKPLRRMIEYVSCIRQILKGDRVTFHGKTISISNFKLMNPPANKAIPIYIAAVNRRMIKLSTEIGDGILLYLKPLDDLRSIISELRELIGERPFEIALSIICAMSDNDPDAAKLRAATTLAFYISTGKYYADYLSSVGFFKEVEQIKSLYAEGGSKAAARGVTEKMLRSLTICGSSEECRRSISEFVSAGITLPIFQLNPVPNAESSFSDVLAAF